MNGQKHNDMNRQELIRYFLKEQGLEEEYVKSLSLQELRDLYEEFRDNDPYRYL